MAGLRVVFVAGFSVLSCAAQQTPKSELVGAVTGIVTCSDTQRPARLAEVKLVRVPNAAEAKSPEKQTPAFGDALPAGNAVETSLDGSYTVRNVKPGLYYVVVDKQGYLLPLSEFTKKELTATDDGTRARVAKSVHMIAVEANQTVKEDVVLDRGASVGGTVTYDDGTAASGIGIQLLKKDKDGKWVNVEFGRYRSMFGLTSTDDTGHYRITGLPPGEYATEANLSLNEFETTFAPMIQNPGQTMEVTMQKTRYSLPLYSGDVLRKSAAEGYSLGSGEARAGSDLVFPLAKLHRVGGQVVTKDGHPVNGGDVKVVWSDDKSEMTEAAIQFEDQAFHLDFVPEGDFLLQISGAKDVTKVQVENPAGYMPRFHEETKTVRTYGDAEQALIVKGDVSDVIAVVPESGKAGATANNP